MSDVTSAPYTSAGTARWAFVDSTLYLRLLADGWEVVLTRELVLGEYTAVLLVKVDT